MIIDVRKELGRFHENTVANLVELQKVIRHARPTYVVDTIADRDSISSLLIGAGDLAYVLDDGTGSPAFYVYASGAWAPLVGTGAGASPSFQYGIGNNITITASANTVPNATLVSGVITITPPMGVEVYEVIIRGDATYTDATGACTLTIDYAWDNGYNTDATDIRLNSVSIWDLTTYDIDGIARLADTSMYPVEVSIPAANELSYIVRNLDLINKWNVIFK